MNMIDLIWDQVEPLIQLVKEKAPDDIDINTIYNDLKNCEKLLVIVSRGSKIIAVNVLEIRTLDTGIKFLSIPIIGGSELDDWAEDFMKIAIAVAKDFGCTELRGFAVRKGWLTKLKPFGWEEMFTTLRCKIGE